MLLYRSICYAWEEQGVADQEYLHMLYTSNIEAPDPIVQAVLYSYYNIVLVRASIIGRNIPKK